MARQKTVRRSGQKPDIRNEKKDRSDRALSRACRLGPALQAAMTLRKPNNGGQFGRLLRVFLPLRQQSDRRNIATLKAVRWAHFRGKVFSKPDQWPQRIQATREMDFVQGDIFSLPVAAMLQTCLAPRRIDQYPPHRFSSRSKEVPTTGLLTS
jgi:hypothetical protein